MKIRAPEPIDGQSGSLFCWDLLSSCWQLTVTPYWREGKRGEAESWNFLVPLSRVSCLLKEYYDDDATTDATPYLLCGLEDQNLSSNQQHLWVNYSWQTALSGRKILVVQMRGAGTGERYQTSFCLSSVDTENMFLAMSERLRQTPVDHLPKFGLPAT